MQPCHSRSDIPPYSTFFFPLHSFLVPTCHPYAPSVSEDLLTRRNECLVPHALTTPSCTLLYPYHILPHPPTPTLSQSPTPSQAQ
ncbi:hypothetical protein E2C01_089753 [Portunus trituberculatus]|uniref:Uncharacterized protein n=1 Tax=Portunus trituberculatus TaxID=210409 RepID=A0A5B7JIC0_PORTR|nr:hypothetical protein [Portunus trituberculatus]